MALAMEASGVDRVPFIWFWPDGAKSAAVMTHDVETDEGRRKVPDLLDLDEYFGIKASFQVVPLKRYPISQVMLETIRERGFEVNVHGLDHSGDLFSSRHHFLEQARQIEAYVQQYGARGFRSPSMYRNAAWLDELNIEYDMSIPTVAHLEPQRGGCCTTFPFFLGKVLELPLSTTQDYSLFNILHQHSMDLWKRQIEAILQQHGMISFNVHPDYAFSAEAKTTVRNLYVHLRRLADDGDIWLAAPGDVNDWWRQRQQQVLSFSDGRIVVEGPGRERARIAFAQLDGGRVSYSVTKSFEAASADVWSAKASFAETSQGRD